MIEERILEILEESFKILVKKREVSVNSNRSIYLRRLFSFCVDVFVFLVISILLIAFSGEYLLPIFYILFFAYLEKSIGQWVSGIIIDSKHRNFYMRILRNWPVFYFTLYFAYFRSPEQVELLSLSGILNSIAVTVLVFDKSCLVSIGRSLLDRLLGVSFSIDRGGVGRSEGCTSNH